MNCVNLRLDQADIDASHLATCRDIQRNAARRIHAVRVVGSDVSFLHGASAPGPFLRSDLHRTGITRADVVVSGREIDQAILAQIVSLCSAAWLQLLPSTGIGVPHDLHLGGIHWIAILIEYLTRDDALRSHLDG